MLFFLLLFGCQNRDDLKRRTVEAESVSQQQSIETVADLNENKEAPLKEDERLESPEEMTLSEDEQLESPEEITLNEDEKLESPEEMTLSEDEKLESPEEITLSEDERLESPEEVTLSADEKLESLEEMTLSADEQLESLEEVTLSEDEVLESPEEITLSADEQLESPEEVTLSADEQLESPEEITLSADGGEIQLALLRESIKQTMIEKNSDITECYDNTVKNESNPPQGRLVVNIKISHTGEFSELIVIEDQINRLGLTQCLTQVLKNLSFKIDGDFKMKYEVEYTFLFLRVKEVSVSV